MKKYISLAAMAACCLMAFNSCQDINLEPKDQIPDSKFWKTPADFIKEVNWLYTRSETFGTKDTDSDIGYELGENTISNGTYLAPNADEDWTARVEELRQCNTILEKAANYQGKKESIARYVAETHFFRAYVYWRWMEKFSAVPIVTKVLDVNSSELYGKRNSQKEVTDFILKELDEAAPNLPLQSELIPDENGRITRGAALALKARVALFAGTWGKYHGDRDDYNQLLQQAIDAANQVIDSKQYSLYEGGGDQSYRYEFIEKGDDSPENIFDNRYYADIRTHSTATSVQWGWRGTPTKKLADMYLCKSTGLPITDPASGFKGYATIEDEYTNRDPRMKQTFLMPGTVYLNAMNGKDSCTAKFTSRPETRTGYKLYKFMGEKVAAVGQTDYDYHIIRYPEVLLILAEATYEKDGAISDDILNKTINVIRSRKGVEMPPLTNAFVKEHNLDMREEIRRERTVELAFEGFRRDDLRRWKTAEAELVKPILGVKLKDSEYGKLNILNDGNPGLTDSDGFLIVEPEEKRKFVSPKNYYYSLPLDELYLNPNLKPNNPGW